MKKKKNSPRRLVAALNRNAISFKRIISFFNIIMFVQMLIIYKTMLLISSCKKNDSKLHFDVFFATIRLLLDKQNGITESGQLNTKSFKPYFVCYGEGHVSFKLCCSTLDKKKKRNIPEVRGEKKTVRSCDILLDHERLAQERSSATIRRFCPALRARDRQWYHMMEQRSARHEFRDGSFFCPG